MNAVFTKRAAGGLSGLVLTLFAGGVAALPEYNMPVGVTDISQEVFDLHMLIYWICVAIGMVVFGAMMISIILHRKSRGHRAAQFHESTTVEIIWTIVPFLILVGMAIPATQTLMAMEDTRQADMSIKITGYQWKWRYDYLDEGIGFFSTLATPRTAILNQEEKGENYLVEVDKPLVVPVDTKIRFLLTSNDVIHAWWVPAFAVKKDAIPGFINQMWTEVNEPGIYRGQCAELCGRDHGFMPVVVKAVPQKQYDRWVMAQKGEQKAETQAATGKMGMEDLMAQGEKVYGTHCVTCHQADGKGLPPTFPALAGGKIATGDAAAHIDVVVNGVTGTAMQAFGTQLSEAELAAVITYERNAFGNKTGDVVQPSQIKSAR